MVRGIRKYLRPMAIVLSIILVFESFKLASIGTFAEEKPDEAIGEFKYPTEDWLGSVNSYGVFAKNFTNAQHTETNFACHTWNVESNETLNSNNVSRYINMDENYCYVGEAILNLGTFGNMNGLDSNYMLEYFVLPDDVTIDRTYNNGVGVTLSNYSGSTSFNENKLAKNLVNKRQVTSAYHIDFDKAFAALSSYSANKYNQPGNVSYTVADSGNRDITIDLSNLADGEYYVDFPAEIFSSDIYQNSAINIVGLTANRTLVINVKNAPADISLDKKIHFNGQAKDTYQPEGGMFLWNFGPNYNGSISMKKSDFGVILAPNASVYVYYTHNGSVFAAGAKNMDGEIHLNPYKGSPFANPKLKPSPSPSVDPSPSEEPSPSVEPSVDPSPSEEPSPSVDPSVEPSPSEEPSPSVDPSVDPSPSEEPSPSVDPSVDPSPSEEPSPSVDPSADPSADPSPSEEPSPSVDPSADPSPSEEPSPSVDPSADPSAAPSADPSATPSADPSADPSAAPSKAPTGGGDDGDDGDDNGGSTPTKTIVVYDEHGNKTAITVEITDEEVAKDSGIDTFTSVQTGESELPFMLFAAGITILVIVSASYIYSKKEKYRD